MKKPIFTLLALFAAADGWANPYFDPQKIKKDAPRAPTNTKYPAPLDPAELKKEGKDILRVNLKWDSGTDQFSIEALEIEASGTDGLIASSVLDDNDGSFKAKLIDPNSNKVLGYSTIGTGSSFKFLTRGLTFRFPLPAQPVKFELSGENYNTGATEVMLSTGLDPKLFTPSQTTQGVEVYPLKAATVSPRLFINIYGEGYSTSRKNQFLGDAQNVVDTLRSANFPMLENLEFRAVFAPSRQALGTPQNLGIPVPIRDSFLGLYFPYWHNFGRYHHVVYPTSELKYRRAIGSVAYDYPIVLVDDENYWGVGNFKELTAIPAQNDRFSYLLLHEFGHFFGLNEEYDSGGATELAFSPKVSEPWSQNITFHPHRGELKWADLVSPKTALPTATGNEGTYGAFAGGYAETPHEGQVYKPSLSCTMDTGQEYCSVCSRAITQRLKADLGLIKPLGGSGQVSNCSCKSDDNGKTCTIFKGNERLAWSELFGNNSCDNAFCNRYFKLTQKNFCQ